MIRAVRIIYKLDSREHTNKLFKSGVMKLKGIRYAQGKKTVLPEILQRLFVFSSKDRGNVILSISMHRLL